MKAILKYSSGTEKRFPFLFQRGEIRSLKGVISPKHLGNSARQTSNSKALLLYLGHTGRVQTSEGLGSSTLTSLLVTAHMATFLE